MDLVIRGARVVDGTGGPAFLGDLAVAGGTITYVGAQRYTGGRLLRCLANRCCILPTLLGLMVRWFVAQVLPQPRVEGRQGVPLRRPQRHSERLLHQRRLILCVAPDTDGLARLKHMTVSCRC